MKRSAAPLVLLLAFAAQATAAAAAPHGLGLGVRDDSFTSAPGGSLQEEWMRRARTARADLVSLYAGWSKIAPTTLPPGFRPDDPADPSYRWDVLDGAVRSAVAQGLTPLLSVNHAPTWAEGIGRLTTSTRPGGWLPPNGTWKPQPRQLGWFAQALAARYSGHFVDPGRPASGPLPRVRYFQIWGEQNQGLNLNPLWSGSTPVAAALYREMLNAAYAGIHSAQPDAKVIVGGTAPYGDLDPNGFRIPPVTFWRALLCLRGEKLRPIRCPQPARFDIAAHNPINVGSPDRRSSRLNVSTPDVSRLTRIVNRAIETGGALPARPKPFWATELWWDSDPPDPDGVPLHRHARYVARSLFVLWRQGVDAVFWWYLRDQEPGPGGFAANQQSGLFFRDGTAKPAYRAFSFPFVAQRLRGGRAMLWGKAPRRGRVTVERRTRHGWALVARLHAGANRIFVARIRPPRSPQLRARQGRRQSIPWRLP